MNPGDVDLRDFSVAGLDVRFCVSEFSVYESILKPYSTVRATIVDSSNMLNNIMATPNLEMSLSFGQPGQDPYRGSFSLTSIEKGRSASNLRTSVYTITGYSRHMTRFPRVQKAYREMTATDVTQDLISSYLSPDKPVRIMDPARGVLGNQHMPFNINGIQIHKAIRGVLERGVGGNGTAYVFYENNRNMVIDTLENMRDRSTSSPLFTYYQRPLGSDWLRDQVLQNFTILSLREESRKDMTSKVQTENQEINPIDIFSNEENRTIDGQRGLVSTIANLVRNSMRPETNIEDAIAQRKRTAANFDSQSLTIHVPLNVEMTVGEGFNVQMVAPIGDTSFSESDDISGPHVALEVRHTVNMGRKRMMGTSTFAGTKGGEQ